MNRVPFPIRIPSCNHDCLDPALICKMDLWFFFAVFRQQIDLALVLAGEPLDGEIAVADLSNHYIASTVVVAASNSSTDQQVPILDSNIAHGVALRTDDIYWSASG